MILLPTPYSVAYYHTSGVIFCFWYLAEFRSTLERLAARVVMQFFCKYFFIQPAWWIMVLFHGVKKIPLYAVLQFLRIKYRFPYKYYTIILCTTRCLRVFNKIYSMKCTFIGKWRFVLFYHYVSLKVFNENNDHIHILQSRSRWSPVQWSETLIFDLVHCRWCVARRSYFLFPSLSTYSVQMYNIVIFFCFYPTENKLLKKLKKKTLAKNSPVPKSK